MEPFQYVDLDGSDTFRTATLHPGTGSADIHISLVHRKFDQNPSFEALSYVWGDPTVTDVIFVEGYRFNVTKNLFSALRRLRYDDKPRHIWIDALCINQNNIPEREHQVSRMRAIYSGAVQVLIWLGDDDILANNAYHLCGLLLTTFHENPNIFAYNNAQRLRLRNAVLTHSWFREHSKPAVDFLRNEWFRRVWTFQEAYLCRDANVFCGALSFPWKSFVFSWKLLDILGIRLPLDGMESAKTIFATCSYAIENPGRDEEQEEHPLRLSNLLRSTYAHLATHSVDKIFGLLAMVTPREGIQFMPDYTRSIYDVYIHFARLMIQDDGHLQILSDASNLSHNPGLPSWVPDWRGNYISNPLAERIRDWKPKYKIQGELDPPKVIVSFGDPRKLHLRGTRIGIIQSSHTLHSFMRQVRPGVELGRWRDVINLFKDYFNIYDSTALHLPLVYRHTGEPAYTAFVKTIAAGDFPTSTRLSTNDLQDFFPWCHDYLSMTWEDAFRPLLEPDLEVMRNSPYKTVVGAPVYEVLDFLFDRGRPTDWSKAETLNILKAETIYRQIVDEILRSIHEKSSGRRLFLTDQGFLGTCSGADSVRNGDQVFDLNGGDVPFILRETEVKGEFILLGDAYVHGIMDGELWRGIPDDHGSEFDERTRNFEDVLLV